MKQPETIAGRIERGLQERKRIQSPEFTSPSFISSSSGAGRMATEWFDHVTEFSWGICWADDRLNTRERLLICMAAMAVTWRQFEFEGYCINGIRAGLSERELSAFQLLIGVYCGIPAGHFALKGIISAMNANNIPQQPVSKAAKPSDDPNSIIERRALGQRMRERIQTVAVSRFPDGANKMTQDWFNHLTDTAWAKCWNNDALSDRERILILLAVMAATFRSFEFERYVDNALRAGFSEDELAAFQLMMGNYCGISTGQFVMTGINKVLEARTSEQTR